MKAYQSNRLAGLDLLRGVAAFAILLLHAPWPSHVRTPLPRGYLAVDLFFVLSGFVVAAAYHRRLGTIAEFGRYCRARLIRLYPLYCLATLLSAAVILAAAAFGRGSGGEVSTGKLLQSLVPALLFLPTPRSWSIQPAVFFPIVFVAWSLFWELAVNLVYGAVAARLGPKQWVLLTGLGFAGLVVSLHSQGSASDLGVVWRSEWAGGARALFSFFVGVALWRVGDRYTPPRVPVLLLAGAFLLSVMPQTFGGWLYELICIVLLFPLLVWLGADASMGPRVRSAALFAGYLSYPVYLLQVVLALLVPPMLLRLPSITLLGGMAEPVIFVVLTVAASSAVARWFDSPVRARLARRYAPLAPSPAAQSAP